MSSIVGIVFATVLSMLAAGGYWVFAARGIDQVRDSSVAQQGQIINDAAVRYVQDNSAALMAVATATTPANVTVPALACAGYLPASYQGGVACPAPAWPTSSVGVKNAMNQSWLLQVTQPTPGKLQAIVTSNGGTAYERNQSGRMASVAAAIGAQGGFVPYTGQGGDTTLNASNAQGSYGGWSLPNLSSGGYINPGKGHFVSLLSFRSGQSTASTLYRAQVAGQPQLNTMNTPLVMAVQESAGGACTPAQTGAIAMDNSVGVAGLAGQLQTTLTCNGSIWEANGCLLDYSDLDTLQGGAFCYNGSGNPNSPTGNSDWFFMQETRHVNMTNQYAMQRVIGMTGVSVGKVWQRSEQASVWGPWQQTADPGVSISNGSVTATNDLSSQNINATGTTTTAAITITGSASYGAACATVGGVTIGPNGMLLACQGGKWSQTGQTVGAPGGACLYPGAIARDANNNLYICN